MYQDEDFKEIATLPAGELVTKVPGTDIVMPFAAGTVYLNGDKNTLQASLYVSGVLARETGKPKGLFGILGRQLVAQLDIPEVQAEIRKLFSARSVSLFYSVTKDGIEIITLPGSGETNIDATNFSGMIVASYGKQGLLPLAEEVYRIHLEAVPQLKRISNTSQLSTESLRRGGLEKVANGIVGKANRVYEQGLELIERIGL